MFVPTHNRSWEPEAVTLFAATGALSDTRKRQCNTLIKQLKAAGIWSKLDIFYVLANSTSTAAKINWKNPGTHDCTEVSSPIFVTDLGFAQSGSGSYLETNYNPSTNGVQYTLNDCSGFTWQYEPNKSTNLHSATIGGGAGTRFFDLISRYSDGVAYAYLNDNAGTGISCSDGSGLFSASRTASNATALYRNGSLLGTGSTASGSIANTHIGICVDDSFGTCYEGTVGCAGMGASLSATEHAALYTALNTYMQAVVFGSSYQGPGDIVASATAWYGLRAYNKAHIGANCVTVIRASDSTSKVFTTIPGGGVNAADIATFLSSTTGKITEIWDQTGNNNHLTQGTDANRPAFTLNVIGSLPAMTFATAHPDKLTIGATFNGSADVAQPFTISCAIKESGSSPTSTGGTILIADGDTGVYTNDGLSGRIEVYCGTSVAFAMSTGTWHAFQGVANGASSDFNLDGSANTKNPGAANFVRSGTGVQLGGGPSGTAGFDGLMFEAGIWPVAFTGTNSTNMSSNQHSYWGF